MRRNNNKTYKVFLWQQLVHTEYITFDDISRFIIIIFIISCSSNCIVEIIFMICLLLLTLSTNNLQPNRKASLHLISFTRFTLWSHKMCCSLIGSSNETFVSPEEKRLICRIDFRRMQICKYIRWNAPCCWPTY